MPRWQPLHPAYAAKLRRLAHGDLGYAECLRALIPLAEKIEVPRPTYWLVRRFLIEERRRIDARRREWERFQERVVHPMLAGRAPRP